MSDIPRAILGFQAQPFRYRFNSRPTGLLREQNHIIFCAALPVL